MSDEGGRWAEFDYLAREFGDSFYILDDDVLSANVVEFRSAFGSRYPATDIAYPYKANHLPDICRTLARLGVRAEVGSDMDLWLAQRLDVDRTGIISNGPNRSPASLEQVMRDGGTVIADSLRDVRILQELARSTASGEFPVGLRINFPLGGNAHPRLGLQVGSAQFDEAVVGIRRSTGLRLAGLHCHVPSHSVESFAERTRVLIRVADQTIPDGPEYLDIGGGFYGGVPSVYPEPGPAPTISDYAEAVCDQLIARYGTEPSGPRLIVEPGTAMVASAMSLVTRVVSIKTVPGRNFANVAGSILDTSPNTRRIDFPVDVIRRGDGVPGPFEVGGSTLMPDEFMSIGLPGPLAEGDFLVFGRVGAYSISMVAPFLRPDVAVLKRSTASGDWLQVRRAGTPEDVFAGML